MVQALDYSLYDDRGIYRQGRARGDIYKTTSRTLVLFYESANRQAYVLPNLSMVIKDQDVEDDVVCTVKESRKESESTATPSLLRHLLFGLHGSPQGVVSVVALAWEFSHLEDVHTMLGRKEDRESRCIFWGDASTFSTALQIVQQVGVVTVRRKVVHAAVCGDGEEEESDEPSGFTPLPLLPPPAMDSHGGGDGGGSNGGGNGGVDCGVEESKGL